MSAAAAGVSASAFAAVTASSSLQHFSLKVWDYPQPPEQLQIWQHMFPAGHTLPHLTSLVLECRVPPVSHLQLMVQCCPALCRLHLSSASQAEAWMHLGALQSLRRLTSLQVTHYVWRDEGLALLTGLQELRLFDSSLTDAATAQLTSLQQLTDLYIDSASFCFMYGPDNKMLKGRHRNVLKLDLSRVGPPVWMQLRECCERADAARREREEFERSNGYKELYTRSLRSRRITLND